AQQGRGRRELLDLIQHRLPEAEEPAPDLESAMKLAIVGRRNTGKSTFINALAQAERVIVSEVPGTTRDSVDVRFERDGKVFIANNWALMMPTPAGKMVQYLRAVFPSLDYVPIAFITATSGKNVYAALNLAQNLFKQASVRVGTGDLNRVLREALERQPPPM